MQLVSGLNGIAAPFWIHTIDPKSWGKQAFCLRALGCGFPVHENGLLGTCAHIVRGLAADREMLVVQHPTEGVCHLVKEVIAHGKYDFALLKIDAKFSFVPTAILGGDLPLGVESFAYGYYDCTIEEGMAHIVPQVYSGHITATPRRFKRTLETKLPFYQMSFPSLSGFSGSPLYSRIDQGFALAGMMFGNESSEVVERFVTESDDGTGRVIEKVSRIFESGVAHTSDSIKSFAQELGYSLWP